MPPTGGFQSWTARDGTAPWLRESSSTPKEGTPGIKWQKSSYASGTERRSSVSDHDPWGRPYRLVLGKLKPSTPPLTEFLEPAMFERALTTLFPRDASGIPATETHLTVYDSPAPVTQAELHAAVRKMTAKNTAPGPDGVPGKALALALTVLEPKLASIFNQCLREGRVPT